MEITKTTLKNLDDKIQKERDAKRKIFLMATRNRYSEKIGEKAPYKF